MYLEHKKKRKAKQKQKNKLLQRRYEEDSISRGSYDEYRNQPLYDNSKTNSQTNTKDMTTKRTTLGKPIDIQKTPKDTEPKDSPMPKSSEKKKKQEPILQWGKIQ